MGEHTPEPWGVERQEDLCPDGNGYIWAIKAKRKSEEKNADGGWKHYVQNPAYANSEANARLIAAAPELLAALRQLMEWEVRMRGVPPYGGRHDEDTERREYEVWQDAQAATAKATS